MAPCPGSHPAFTLGQLAEAPADPENGGGRGGMMEDGWMNRRVEGTDLCLVRVRARGKIPDLRSSFFHFARHVFSIIIALTFTHSPNPSLCAPLSVPADGAEPSFCSNSTPALRLRAQGDFLQLFFPSILSPRSRKNKGMGFF